MSIDKNKPNLKSQETPQTQEALIPAVIQHAITGQVLMVGFTNAVAQDATDKTGFVHFYSRSRQQLWRKGETSGNGLKLISKAWDCDQDTLLYQVIPQGPTCHTGAISCFDNANSDFSSAEPPPCPSNALSPIQSSDYLLALEARLKARSAQVLAVGENSYTQRLIQGTKGHLMRKLLEEAAEVADAFVEDQENLADEAADLLYHLLVLLQRSDLSLGEVYSVLQSRER